MQYKVGHITDIGLKRSQNQDSSIALPECGLFIVADGMGGHRGGETASATAIEVISTQVKKAILQKDWNPQKVISEAIQAANAEIYALGLKEPSLQGMGTTVTALLFKNQHLTLGHVGDSRCYFLKPQAIWQLTRDHSLVQEKLRAGLITRKDVKTDQMKNVITRSVGFENQVSVEVYQFDIRSGDCFLICSDGLSGLVDDLEILKIVQKYFFEENNVQKAACELTAAANQNGGDDNITTLLVQVI